MSEPRLRPPAVNLGRFFERLAELYAASNAAHRDCLDWAGWNEWANAAVRAGLLTADEVRTGIAGDWVGTDYGHLWRCNAFHQLRRVREAKERGETPEQFHRNEIRAMQADAKRAASESKWGGR
jgi:hypothetical protein